MATARVAAKRAAAARAAAALVTAARVAVAWGVARAGGSKGRRGREGWVRF